MMNYKDHWNKVFTRTPITQTGWYEKDPNPSIQLIENCRIKKDRLILDIGSGTSTLITHLLKAGYSSIYAVDISEVALEKAKAELGGRASEVHWVLDDITNSSAVMQLKEVAIWHDRAMFHFLIEEHQRQAYLSVLRKVVIPGGHIILATFSQNAAERCSGLPVQRYSLDHLSDFFCKGFRLQESMDYSYTMPSGDLRPYIYARFQKIDD